jgi:hypothetical protein
VEIVVPGFRFARLLLPLTILTDDTKPARLPNYLTYPARPRWKIRIVVEPGRKMHVWMLPGMVPRNNRIACLSN